MDIQILKKLLKEIEDTDNETYHILNIKLYLKLFENVWSRKGLGDIPYKAGDYKGFSSFYGIEKKIIFGGE